MGLYQAACPQCQKEHLWFSGISDQRCEACKNPFAPTPQQPLDDCTKAKLGLFDPAKPVPGQQKQSPTPQPPAPREVYLAEGVQGLHVANKHGKDVVAYVERSALTAAEENLKRLREQVNTVKREHADTKDDLTACEAKLTEAEERWERQGETLGKRIQDLVQQLQTERERADKCETAMNAAHESLKWSKEYDGKILQERDAARAEYANVCKFATQYEEERDRYRQLLVDIEEGKYTYYEHDHQPDGTFTPSYFDVIREALKESQE